MPNWGGGASGAASGAAKGAAIGSIVPGIGTGIGAAGGAIIGGLKGLFSKKKKKPGEEDKDAKGDMDLLRQHAGEQDVQGDALSAQGQAALAPSMSYFKDILGADPSASMAATAGARGRVIDQYDTARQAASRFGPRGGGQQATIAQSYFQQANQLSDISSQAKSDAASQLGQLGATMTGLGLSAEQLASADLSTVIQAVLGQKSLDLQKRGQTMQMWGDIGSGVGSIVGSVLLGGKG